MGSHRLLPLLLVTGALLAACSPSVNVTGPVTGGVPVSSPDVLSDNQVGSPLPIQVYVPLPPLAVNWKV